MVKHNDSSKINDSRDNDNDKVIVMVMVLLTMPIIEVNVIDDE